MKTILSILFTACLLIGLSHNANAQKRKPGHKRHHAGKPGKRNAHSKTRHRAKRFHKRANIKAIKKRKIRAIAALPGGHLTIKHRGKVVHHKNGVFYCKHNNGFRRYFPGRGLRIKVLPVGHRKVRHHKGVYFYHAGVFYVQRDNEYEVVQPEQGTIIKELPQDELEEVMIDDEKYMELNETLYVAGPDAGTWEVAGSIED